MFAVGRRLALSPSLSPLDFITVQDASCSRTRLHALWATFHLDHYKKNQTQTSRKKHTNNTNAYLMLPTPSQPHPRPPLCFLGHFWRRAGGMCVIARCLNKLMWARRWCSRIKQHREGCISLTLSSALRTRPYCVQPREVEGICGRVVRNPTRDIPEDHSLLVSPSTSMAWVAHLRSCSQQSRDVRYGPSTTLTLRGVAARFRSLSECQAEKNYFRNVNYRGLRLTPPACLSYATDNGNPRGKWLWHKLFVETSVTDIAAELDRVDGYFPNTSSLCILHSFVGNAA